MSTYLHRLESLLSLNTSRISLELLHNSLESLQKQDVISRESSKYIKKTIHKITKSMLFFLYEDYL